MRFTVLLMLAENIKIITQIFNRAWGKYLIVDQTIAGGCLHLGWSQWLSGREPGGSNSRFKWEAR